MQLTERQTSKEAVLGVTRDEYWRLLLCRAYKPAFLKDRHGNGKNFRALRSMHVVYLSSAASHQVREEFMRSSRVS
jgi:hypothetical protein